MTDRIRRLELLVLVFIDVLKDNDDWWHYADSEQRQLAIELTDALIGMKRGSCWCATGTRTSSSGEPVAHTDSCRAAQVLIVKMGAWKEEPK